MQGGWSNTDNDWQLKRLQLDSVKMVEKITELVRENVERDVVAHGQEYERLFGKSSAQFSELLTMVVEKLEQEGIAPPALISWLKQAAMQDSLPSTGLDHRDSQSATLPFLERYIPEGERLQLGPEPGSSEFVMPASGTVPAFNVETASQTNLNALAWGGDEQPATNGNGMQPSPVTAPRSLNSALGAGQSQRLSGPHGAVPPRPGAVSPLVSAWDSSGDEEEGVSRESTTTMSQPPIAAPAPQPHMQPQNTPVSAIDVSQWPLPQTAPGAAIDSSQWTVPIPAPIAAIAQPAPTAPIVPAPSASAAAPDAYQAQLEAYYRASLEMQVPAQAMQLQQQQAAPTPTPSAPMAHSIPATPMPVASSPPAPPALPAPQYVAPPVVTPAVQMPVKQVDQAPLPMRPASSSHFQLPVPNSLPTAASAASLPLPQFTPPAPPAAPVEIQKTMVAPVDEVESPWAAPPFPIPSPVFTPNLQHTLPPAPVPTYSAPTPSYSPPPPNPQAPMPQPPMPQPVMPQPPQPTPMPQVPNTLAPPGGWHASAAPPANQGQAFPPHSFPSLPLQTVAPQAQRPAQASAAPQQLQQVGNKKESDDPSYDPATAWD
jgi:hypothetical protein